MFLSDLSENVALFRRKRYEEYLRENKPEVYDAMTKTRKELSDFVNKQRVNKQSKKPTLAVVVPKRGMSDVSIEPLPENMQKLIKTKNTYRLIRDMGMSKENGSGITQGLKQLNVAEKRATTPLSFSNPGLPRLETLERGQALPELGKPLNIPTSKPRGNVDVKPSARLAKTTIVKREMKKMTLPVGKMLAGLGGIAAVGGLGYYGLKKYDNDSRQKNKKR